MDLPYGWRDGTLVSIDEVERGLACNCICPACKAPLVAKKGASKVHHFSHYRGTSCAGGLETVMHLLAKSMLMEARRLMVPPVLMDNSRQVLFPGRVISFDRVVSERRVRKLVPDLVVAAGSRRLLVEVAVTHRVDALKLRRLTQLGYAALEVDLRDYYRAAKFDVAAFRGELLYGVERKGWLFNPRKQALQSELRRRAHRRVVRRRRGHGGKIFYVVQPCPQEKRCYHYGDHKMPFAYVFGDCLHCPFALEIIYQMVLRAFREVPTEPREVVCWGHDPELWEKLR